jgi:hypothetical protein
MSVLQASDGTSQQKNFACKKRTLPSRKRAKKNYAARLNQAEAPVSRRPTKNRIASQSHGTPLDSLLLEFCPWTVDRYPGLGRFAAGLFRGRAPYHTVRDWRRGRRPLPHWACILLADYLAARITRLAALETELRQLARERAEIDARRLAHFRSGRLAKKKPAG